MADFGLLIDQRADSKNHASHLIITKAERAELLHAIDESFGKKLDDKNANDLVSSGATLKLESYCLFPCLTVIRMAAT